MDERAPPILNRFMARAHIMRPSWAGPARAVVPGMCNYCAEKCCVNKLVNTINTLKYINSELYIRATDWRLWRCKAAPADLLTSEGYERGI